MTLPPDVEALVASHLRGRQAVSAIVGQRVGTRTPGTLAAPWVRLTQINDEPATVSSALHLVTVWLQIDCYAGDDRDHGQEQASLLARTVRDELHRMPGTYSTGVVTAVRFSGTRRAPDDDLDPARERYSFDAYLSVHP
jgi:hypothetical protein